MEFLRWGNKKGAYAEEINIDPELLRNCRLFEVHYNSSHSLLIKPLIRPYCARNETSSADKALL
jgi:hypothetical protein